MSAAAEGIAGLTLSAISVAALFTTCIECFDIVVAGKNFSEDYEQLCALVRYSINVLYGEIRLTLWPGRSSHYSELDLVSGANLSD
jgi:hypothetical protein